MDIQNSFHYQDASFEKDHWWIKSRFRLIDTVVRRIKSVSFSVLELGCGTGVNLRYLRDHYADRLTDLRGVDPYAPPVKEQGFSIDQEIPRKGDFDFILAMDVLEHLDNPRQFLSDIRPLLRTGGILLITVPAFQWLWTSYDDVSRHKKRYSYGDLESEITSAGFQKEKMFFLFGALFPLFVLQRLSLRWFPKPNEQIFKPTSPWLNTLLFHVTSFEIGSWMPFNRFFGSSLVALCSLAHG